tara:strand:- start:892 stop:1125 length:234 start_codon:yes stop_codon:yes gene_type:complete
MKTIANFGLMEVISEDNKDTIIFNHSSGCVTFVIIFKKGKASIKHAYWRHLSFGGRISGSQNKLWKVFNEKIKKSAQ